MGVICACKPEDVVLWWGFQMEESEVGKEQLKWKIMMMSNSGGKLWILKEHIHVLLVKLEGFRRITCRYFLNS